jgi:hypothetical protein
MKEIKLTFGKAKSQHHPDSVKPSNFCWDELGHLNTSITLYPLYEQLYNGTKPDINFNDEVGQFSSTKKSWWQEVPKDLADALTKETVTKLGIKK